MLVRPLVAADDWYTIILIQNLYNLIQSIVHLVCSKNNITYEDIVDKNEAV